jgi:DNA-directed RNA polymerase, beta' subunit
MIEGKAIQLHPLVTTAFNADFDGDQMAVHLPLGPEAILEAQLLMLGSQNILNPANGSPITVPSQDMVLGLYFMTKEAHSTDDYKVKGEGLVFYSPEEAEIAYAEGKASLNAKVKCRLTLKENGELVTKLIPTTVGRILFNQIVPKEVGYIDTLLTKKSLRDVIGTILAETDFPTTVKFLDDMKNLGYMNAFKGGLSFSLADIVVPEEKKQMIAQAVETVDGIKDNYNMGLITDTERYNQVIDVWTNTNAGLTEMIMSRMKTDQGGFNSVYMMLDSGARGSKEQIRQLSGMRGLMAKPQKAGSTGAEIIENPIVANFKEGLSILEYFISTHGARKGLADTALKTADAGYLTRRLVDVAQDVIITEDDCGTLRGVEVSPLKKNDEIVEKLSERILGRVSLHDVYDPETDELIVAADQIISEALAKKIEDAGIETVEVRSPLSCEAKKGICARCYGRNLATGKMIHMGEAVGVIAAQSIGEPGTQLTLRTFHQGGTAGNVSVNPSITARRDGIVEMDEVRTITSEDENGNKTEVVVSRSTEFRLVADNEARTPIMVANIPYGAVLSVKPGDKVKKGDLICKWDPYNAVIIAETTGKIEYEDIIQGRTFQLEIDEQTGFEEKVISESRDKKAVPTLRVVDSKGVEQKAYNLPVGAHLMVNDGEKIKAGKILIKIPRKSAKAGDITGGLPRVTELFEARNPSNPAVVTEIDGVVSYGKIKRGNRELIVESRTGEIRKYLVKLSSQIIVQENDFVRAGDPLSDGAITPDDILAIKGPTAVQEYIVNEIQEVYRLQGVKIDDKHFEIIVRQMMTKVEIVDAGDTQFLEGSLEHKLDFIEENDRVFGLKVVVDAGDSKELKPGQMITARELRDENSKLKREDLQLVQVREALTATANPVLQGITRAALQTKSFMSAASFQETTKVLNEAAVSGKVDELNGLKENVIVGHRIPAGTGLKDYQNIIVGSNREFEDIK